MTVCWRAPARLLVLVATLVKVCMASQAQSWTPRAPSHDSTRAWGPSLRVELPSDVTVRQPASSYWEGDADANRHAARLISWTMPNHEVNHSSLPGGAQQTPAKPGAAGLGPTGRQPALAWERGDPVRRFPSTLRAGNLRASLGPQRLAYSSLIHRDHERRGAVAEWRVDAQTQIRGFGMQSQTDGDSPLLTGDDTARYQLNGLVVQRAVEIGDENQLGLAAAWISGRTRRDDSGWHAGDAWSVAGEASALSERLHVHAEYAGSRPDRSEDSASAPATAGDTADAVRLGAEVRASADFPAAWRLGTSFSEVAWGFASPGNPELATNRRELRAYAGAELGVWDLDLSFDRQRDNRARDPSRPTVVRDTWRLSTLGSPAAAKFSKARSYRFTATYSRHRPVSDSADADSRAMASDDLTLEGEIDATDWQLGLRLRGGIDAGPVDRDGGGATSLGLDLYGGLSGDLPLPIQPTLAWERREATRDGSVSDVWRAAANLPSVVLRHDIEADLDLAFQHRSKTDDQPTGFSAGIGLDLVWKLQRPTAYRQGLTLSVSGKLSSSATGNDGTEDAGYGLMISLTGGNPHGGR